MTIKQQAARIAIFRWVRDRQILRNGRLAAPRGAGRPTHKPNPSLWDARIVRALDFERVFSGLDTEQQAVLLAIYREGFSESIAAEFIGCSPRKIAYVKPVALDALAEALDREDLL